MANPATVTKTLTITMLSLSAGKVRFPTPAVPAAQPAATKPMSAKLPMPSASGPVVPVVPVHPPLPTAKDGFHLMLAASDGSRSYGTKLLALCDGKVSTDRGATDLGDIPTSLATAIATLQSEVAALITSLTGSGKLTF